MLRPLKYVYILEESNEPDVSIVEKNITTAEFLDYLLTNDLGYTSYFQKQYELPEYIHNGREQDIAKSKRSVRYTTLENILHNQCYLPLQEGWVYEVQQMGSLVTLLFTKESIHVQHSDC